MKNIKINGYNNLPLNVYLFDEVKNPRASIIVVHGMQEHAKRYFDFAEFLQKNGFVVLLSDLRGHGFTATSKEDFGKGQGDDIFAEIIEDQKILCEYLKNQYNLPLYLFGHSFGSFVAQKLIQVYPNIKKAVICGTTNGSSAKIFFGKVLAGFLMGIGQKNNHNSLVQKVSLDSYGKKFEDKNWLTRDTKVWEEYKKDELCGVSFPLDFYYSMLKNLNKVNRGIKKLDKNKPIMFICGSDDPVGEYSKQVTRLYKKYKKKGLNASLKIYPQARHELINEINKEEVYNDILNFYNN